MNSVEVYNCNMVQWYNYIYEINNYRKKLLCTILLRKRNRKRKQVKRFWIDNIFTKRHEQGVHDNLIAELRLGNREKFFNYLRMTPEVFNRLLTKMSHKIQKCDLYREPISPSERLALTIRYLAAGDSMVSISYNFRVGYSTVSSIIYETCSSLWEILKDEVLSKCKKENWLRVAEGFEKQWNFPHCIGAIDGKHIRIQAPPQSGSEYFNYKNFSSIILLAICDSDYCYTVVDIGASGRQSDGGVFRNSAVGQTFFTNTFDLPPASPLEQDGPLMPYVLIGDEAFQLTEFMMRPYAGGRNNGLTIEQEIFNYRLSRARRIIENTFGIMVAKWRILQQPISASLKTTEVIVQAIVVLHNFIIQSEKNLLPSARTYCPPNLVDHIDSSGSLIEGSWRQEEQIQLKSISKRSASNACSRNACVIRNNFKDYFNSAGGSVSWQNERILNKKYF